MSEANVFISWSGTRSKAMAEALRDWLPHVIQSVVPFFSDKDIDSGAFWDDSIRASLDSARFAVICCTPANVTAPWLNYEAGALAERLKGRTAPWLLDAKPEALGASPIFRLQARTSDKPGTLAVLQSLNASLSAPLGAAILTAAFETHWDKLDEKLKAIPPPEVKTPERKDRDMLEEIVKLCREISRVRTFSPVDLPPDSIRRMVDEEVRDYLRDNHPDADAGMLYDLATQAYPLAQQYWRTHGAMDSDVVRRFVRMVAEPDEVLFAARVESSGGTPWHTIRKRATAIMVRFARHMYHRELTPEELESWLLSVRQRVKGHRVNEMDVAAAITHELVERLGPPPAPRASKPSSEPDS
jgi:hypothetical protein